jgi:hypothetical protein
MVKLLVFAILLASSPATGLIDTLFRTESSCYSGCEPNYGTSAAHLDACKKGCDYKLQNEPCADQCTKLSSDPQIQNSCQVGCTLGDSTDNKDKIEQSDPVSEVKDLGAVSVADAEPEPPRSIILIRLRQRPLFGVSSIHMPPPEELFNKDPIQFFNDIIKQFQEKANEFEQSARQSFQENSKDFPKLSELTKNIPIIRLPGNIRGDSSSESSEEKSDNHPLIDEFKHIFQHRDENAQPLKTRVRQFFTDVRSEWNDLVRKQPKIPVWIFLGILLASSAILWHMVMSLCHQTPSRDVLTVRAQELIFHPYEGDAYEKEKIQPNDEPYEVTESLPIKVKLSNI